MAKEIFEQLENRLNINNTNNEPIRDFQGSVLFMNYLIIYFQVFY